MIKKSIAAFVILALCLPFVVGSASAVEKKKPISGTPPKHTTTSMPLTEQECTKLGGQVLSGATYCEGGKSCVTYDEQNQRHEVCISASKK